MEKQIASEAGKELAGVSTESPRPALDTRLAAQRLVNAAIRSCYEKAKNPLAEGTQQLDGEWLMPLWGCDTLDHLRDELVARIRRVTAKRKTGRTGAGRGDNNAGVKE